MKNEQTLTSETEVKEYLKKLSNEEQVYSIALFDILGFSNYVETHGNKAILELYEKLLNLVHKQASISPENDNLAGSVVPIRISEDWKHIGYAANANGFISVCHFSDTFLIYVNYCLCKPGFWLADTKEEPYPLLLGEIGTRHYPIVYEKHPIYLSFLQTCMDFFCQAIVDGIPLRGCIGTGLAIMNQDKSIYLGEPLVEVAKGETAQNALGIAFGKSFNNSHPVYNDYFIPYLAHIKDEKESKNCKYLSPMMLDWARYWRESPNFNKYSLKNCINKMNKNPAASFYYDNAIKFFEFSSKNEKWSLEIKRDEIKDITDYYDRVKEWYENVKLNHR